MRYPDDVPLDYATPPPARPRVGLRFCIISLVGGGAWVDAQRAFVSLLFRERDLSRCFFSTSHATLCISRYADYSEGADKPLLTATAQDDKRILLELRVKVAGAGDGASPSFAFRSVTYSCMCTTDRALTEFDSLYAMFIDEHG